MTCDVLASPYSLRWISDVYTGRKYASSDNSQSDNQNTVDPTNATSTINVTAFASVSSRKQLDLVQLSYCKTARKETRALSLPYFRSYNFISPFSDNSSEKDITVCLKRATFFSIQNMLSVQYLSLECICSSLRLFRSFFLFFPTVINYLRPI